MAISTKWYKLASSRSSKQLLQVLNFVSSRQHNYSYSQGQPDILTQKVFCSGYGRHIQPQLGLLQHRNLLHHKSCGAITNSCTPIAIPIQNVLFHQAAKRDRCLFSSSPTECCFTAFHLNTWEGKRFKSNFHSEDLREAKSARPEDGNDKSEAAVLSPQTKRENIKTIPNLLTTLRMASAPFLSYLVINDQFGYAFSIFVLAGFSDMVDGYIARNFKNQRTAFGTALDPLADKFLISFLTVSLTISGLIPVPVTALILSRDAGLVIASFYIRYMSLAPPRTLSRYFDFSHITAKVYPSTISKINTAFQFSYVALSLAAPVFDFVESPWLQLLMYTTAATTFLSGADYMLTWRRRLKIIQNT